MHALTTLAAILGFAGGGGWLAARVARTFSSKSVSVVAMIGACGAIAAWACFAALGNLALGLSLLLGWALLVLAAVDWLAFRLPDMITLPLIVAGLIAAQLLPGEHVLEHLAAALIGYTTFWAIAWVFRQLRGKEGLGLGDAKLAAAAGSWLGLVSLPSVLLLASVAGIAWVLMRTLFKGRAALSERIAFGIPLCAAIWIVRLYGPLTITLPAPS